MKYAIVLPVLNPDIKMNNFVDVLTESGFQDIIIVNDGSKEDTVHFFEEAARHPEVTVLVHEVNKGKGCALKTAFSYLAEQRKDIDAAITADGDGQHDVASIRNCIKGYEEHPHSVIIGGRDFDQPGIPERSRKGNKISSVVYKFACGIKLKDTQTGLRIIPSEHFDAFSKLNGDRYEYETNMLIAIVNMQIPYYEVPINTIYINENETSHFNPIKDSVKIYWVVLRYFLKFVLSSMISWAVDIGVYALLQFILEKNATNPGTQVLVCTVSSRVISSFCNYLINRNGVFKSKDQVGNTVLKYYILAICQMMVSFGLVRLFTDVLKVDGVLELIVKCVVDLLLFVFSYGIQRKWVFKNKK